MMEMSYDDIACFRTSIHGVRGIHSEDRYDSVCIIQKSDVCIACSKGSCPESMWGLLYCLLISTQVDE